MIKKILIATTMLITLQANALVGLVMPSSALIIAGSLISGASLYVGGTSSGSAGRITSVMGLMLGLVALEESGDFEYKALSSEDGQKLGVSDFERSAFNSELEEVNMIFDAIKAEKEHNPTMTREDISNSWHELSDGISDESFTVLTAISQTLNK